MALKLNNEEAVAEIVRLARQHGLKRLAIGNVEVEFASAPPLVKQLEAALVGSASPPGGRRKR